MEVSTRMSHDRITTTTSTIITRPISCAAPSPPFSPKRKSLESYELGTILTKKPKLSVTEYEIKETPNSPLYKNFGNGLSLCNNTKTNRFANIDEILQYLAHEDSEQNATVDINEQSPSEDIFNEIIDDLYETKELPELTLNLWDLRDMLQIDLKL